MRIEAGTQLGHYEIRSRIGAGGMGEVYLAEDTRLNRKVALKFLPAESVNDTDRLHRFLQEAKTASALNHPNIIVIHEIGETDNTHFIAAEFIEGETLRERLKRSAFTIDEILDVGIQIASALQAAHSAKIVHRDIKPANVMVRPDGLVKVLDFGLAKLSEPPAVAGGLKVDAEAETRVQVQTQAGMILGTAAYMSPEQARGKTVDARTDIFSLGVVLYEMLAGRQPFTGETINHIIVAILEQAPPPLSQFVQDYPGEMERIVGKALAKNADERYQTAKELLTDLKSLQKRLELAAELERASQPNKQAEAETQIFTAVVSSETPSIPLNNLTENLSPFVGREKEIAEIQNLLKRADVRLLTMTGVGGTGKTRLAQAVARRMLEEFSDGVFFIELAAISDPQLVASSIAQPLGVREAGGKPLVDVLKDYLRGKRMLLVVDNFEQVLAAAPLVAELLAASPQTKILITSRALLHVRVEREFIVPPLEAPSEDLFGDEPPATASDSDVLGDWQKYAAVRLFVERARSVKPSFALTNENARSVAAVCARLDGLPLAIELAAARVKILSPPAILSKLENSLQLLTGGARDLPARQQTMRGAVEWSYDLLTEDEKRLFRRLAVFAGGFTLEAAEEMSVPPAVAGGSIAEENPPATAGGTDLLTLDLITSLIDKSLLVSKEQANGEYRFRMLEVVREYALESLAATGEAEAMRRRHAAYFLALGEAAEPHLQAAQAAKWLDRLEEEHDNLRAALAWSLERDVQTAARLAAAIRAFWNLHTHLTEGRGWLKAALESDNSDALSAVRCKLLNGLGQFARHQGDYETARKAYEEGLAAGRAADDKRQIALSSRGLGAVAYRQGDFTAARKFIKEGLAISRELNDKSEIAISLNLLGDLAYTEGDDTAARLLLEESLAISRQLGNKEVVSVNLNSLGAVAYGEGNDKAARAHFAEALATTQELGDKIAIAFALDGCAALAAKRGASERAARLAGAADHLRELIGFEMVNSGGDSDREITADHLREVIGSEIAPAERRFRDVYLLKLRAALSEAAFAAAYEQGRKLKLDEAMALALDEAAP